MWSSTREHGSTTEEGGSGILYSLPINLSYVVASSVVWLLTQSSRLSELRTSQFTFSKYVGPFNEFGTSPHGETTPLYFQDLVLGSKSPFSPKICEVLFLPTGAPV